VRACAAVPGLPMPRDQGRGDYAWFVLLSPLSSVCRCDQICYGGVPCRTNTRPARLRLHVRTGEIEDWVLYVVLLLIMGIMNVLKGRERGAHTRKENKGTPIPINRSPTSPQCFREGGWRIDVVA